MAILSMAVVFTCSLVSIRRAASSFDVQELMSIRIVL